MTVRILALILSIQLLYGCGNRIGNNTALPDSTSNASEGAANPVKDNVEELGMLVRLPFEVEVEEAVWKEEPMRIPGTEQNASANQKKLTAVLRFSSENGRKVAGQVEKVKAGEPAILGTERWFPAELIAQSELNGADNLKGMSYAAADFYLPPYSEGRITQVENTDYFVLELFAK